MDGKKDPRRFDRFDEVWRAVKITEKDNGKFGKSPHHVTSNGRAIDFYVCK